MTEKRLPDWDNDPLSVFFRDTEQNVRVTALNSQRSMSCSDRCTPCSKNLKKHQERSLERACCYSFSDGSVSFFFLGRIRLVMSGQVQSRSQSFVLWSNPLGTALHMAKDPGGTKRYEIWRLRDENDEAKKRCRNEFTVARVRRTHEALDAATAKGIPRGVQGLNQLWCPSESVWRHDGAGQD